MAKIPSKAALNAPFNASTKASIKASINTSTKAPSKVLSNAAIDTPSESDQVFDLAAELFRVMAAPLRLKIISSLCDGEKTVSVLLGEISTTQPNMSQHLSTLYQAGVLGKRRDGVNIYYRIVNQRVVTLCRAVCIQIASEADFAQI